MDDHIGLLIEVRRLEIDDDGMGFDLNRLREEDSQVRGAGIFTMEERARLMGGTCVIESQPGQGTRVRVKIPTVMDRAYEQDPGADR